MLFCENFSLKLSQLISRYDKSLEMLGWHLAMIDTMVKSNKDAVCHDTKSRLFDTLRMYTRVISRYHG